MTEEKDLITQGGGALMVSNLEEQVNTIQLAMKSLMKDGTHYGKIPGCGDKPALLKPGAEKILFMFKMAPKFEVETIRMDKGHREIIIKSVICDSQGRFLGEGLGSCSTLESKYRWRNAGKVCPECGNQGSIFRQKADYGGGWYCNQGKGGCNEKFKPGTDGCKLIENQDGGKVENPDIADQYNTVLKMAKKRSLVDGTLTVTAASDVFEQDLDTATEAELQAIREEKTAGKVDAIEIKDMIHDITQCETKASVDSFIASNKAWIDSLEDEDKAKIRSACQNQYDIFKPKA